MTPALAYLLAVLLVPVAISLMLFVMARIEGEPASAPTRLPDSTDSPTSSDLLSVEMRRHA